MASNQVRKAYVHTPDAQIEVGVAVRVHARRQIYATRSDARADIFSYIEMFYNPKRRHGTAGDTSPVEFERRHSQRLTGV